MLEVNNDNSRLILGIGWPPFRVILPKRLFQQYTPQHSKFQRRQLLLPIIIIQIGIAINYTKFNVKLLSM